ncbi:hypothetical protein [Microcoleus sp. B13-B6]|uniref:hypothetical protein n=1 Tax=Microcoleus sp. B13-B6 TaxID=2818652 RepID=UPI00403F3399
MNVEIVTGSLFKTPDIKGFQKKQKIERSAFIIKNILSGDCQIHEGVPAGSNTMCVSTIRISPPESSIKVKKPRQANDPM